MVWGAAGWSAGVSESSSRIGTVGWRLRLKREAITRRVMPKIQAATGNTKLPYIYYFKAGARPPEPINVPYFDG